MNFACKYSADLFITFIFKRTSSPTQRSVKPINLHYKIDWWLIELLLNFFFASKYCQPLFSVELQASVLFQKEVTCICVLAVTVLSSNSFQAIGILSINPFRHILFLASLSFLYNETSNVRVPEKKKSNTKLCIIIAPLRTTVVCYQVWQVCTKPKGLSLHGIFIILSY